MATRVFEKWRGHSLRTQLVVIFLLLAVVPAMSVVVLKYQVARQGLNQAAEFHLHSISKSHAIFLDEWFNDRLLEAAYLADTDYTKVLLNELVAVEAQAELSSVGSPLWQRTVHEHEMGLVNVRNHFAFFHDLYLISPQGKILYSTLMRDDLGGSLVGGRLASTRFADATRAALQDREQKFSDFERYRIVDDLVSGFIVTPILGESGDVLGAFAVQMRLDKIETAMGNAPNAHSYHYLVGQDGRLRSSISGDSEQVLLQQVQSVQVRAWQQGETSPNATNMHVERYVGPKGSVVLGVQQALDVGGVSWLLVSEWEETHALGGIRSLGWASIWILLLIAIPAAILGLWMARRIIGPLRALASSAEAAARGNLDAQVEVGAKNEIGHLAHTFNHLLASRKDYENELGAAMQQAQTANKAKSDFLACMSHEIRTPMNGILGMLGLVQRAPMRPEQQRKLSIAYDSAKDLLTLINNVLDVARFERDQVELEAVPFSIAEQLEQVIREQSRLAHAKGLEVVLDAIELKHHQVTGDPLRFRQILAQLVDNAIKFTEAGVIVVKAGSRASAENKVLFECEVRDSGIGISPEKMDSLFDAFTQVDVSTTREYTGMGLGLTIVKTLCQLMGGDVDIESEVDEGTAVRFHTILSSVESLPVLDDCMSADLSRLRVLVVDDLATNREILREQLHSWGVHVEECGSAHAALTLLEHSGDEAFDVVLLDYQMPEMDGLSFARRWRLYGKSSPKLLLLSSVQFAEKIENLSDVGFSGCLIKPTMPSTLHKALALLTTKQDGAPAFVTSSVLEAITADDDTGSEDSAQGGPSGRVLVVEDNAINQDVISCLLSDWGLEVEVAANGRIAIDTLKNTSQAFDLVLMDCQMPQMDGYEATRAIRRGEAGARAQQLPIVALTANALRGDKERCLAAGMDDFLGKPIDPDLVLQSLRKHMRSNTASAPSATPTPQVNAATMPKQSEATVMPEGLKTLDFSVRKPDIARKKKSFVRVLKTYVRQSEGLLDALQADFEQADWKNLREKLHALKGASGNLAMMPLYESVQQAEGVLREGETLSRDSLDEVGAWLTASVDDATRILDANRTEKKPVSSRSYEMVRFELVRSLRNSVAVSPALINEFRSSAKSEMDEASIDALIESIDNFDYEEALGQL